MEVRGSDAISALRWGLSRYAWLFVLYVVALTALVPVVVLRATVSYDAEAIVVAQRLDMDLIALPRYGEAVFDNGEVARAIAARFAGGSDFEDIVPVQASLVAEQDSIVLRVVGHDAAPDIAADLANTAAAAFVDELNAPGEGVGVFTIQSDAVPPSEPADSLPGLSLLIPVGLIAGVALGLGAVAVVLVVRRPVLEAADAEQATGVPVLASVTLPRFRHGQFPSADDVVGTIPLCRRVLALDTDAVILVGTPRTARARSQLAVALASVLTRVSDLRFVASVDARRAVRMLAGPDAGVAKTSGRARAGGGAGRTKATSGSRPTATSRRRRITLVDSNDSRELVGSASALTLLLVPHGMSLRAVREAAGEYLGGGDAGLVLVRRGRRRAERATRPSPDERRPDDASDSGRADTDDRDTDAAQPSNASVGR